MSRRDLRQIEALLLGLASVVACDRATRPVHTTLADLRQSSNAELGQIRGRARAMDPAQPQLCYRSGTPLPGIRIDLGTWNGSPSTYRDTVTQTPPSSLDEPRFRVVASTTSDGAGRFVFADAPRNIPYAVRAVPAASGKWRLTYLETMFGIPRDGGMEDFPTICLHPR